MQDVMIPRRGFILIDHDCKMAQLIVNHLTGKWLYCKVFLWIYIPYGKNVIL